MVTVTAKRREDARDSKSSRNKRAFPVDLHEVLWEMRCVFASLSFRQRHHVMSAADSSSKIRSTALADFGAR